MRAPAVLGALFVVAASAAGVPASAQTTPATGVRAAGMGGAFTAVADDASAVFWNPAGLASGSFFSLVVDRNTFDDRSAALIALGTPPVGIAYYRTAAGALAASPHALVAHHAGITLLQSIGDRVAVGGTLKAVRGVVSSSGASAATTRFDTDIGVMVTGSLVKLGLTVRNLTQPSFRIPGGGETELERQVRAGFSLNTSRRTTAAADFDLTTTATARGDRRDAALGLEANPMKKMWVRGGVHWNTASGGAAPIGSVGASVAVYGSTMADAQISFGSADGDRGWGVGLRFVF